MPSVRGTTRSEWGETERTASLVARNRLGVAQDAAPAKPDGAFPASSAGEPQISATPSEVGEPANGAPDYDFDDRIALSGLTSFARSNRGRST